MNDPTEWEEQARHIVATLAIHLRWLTVVPITPEVRRTSEELAAAALDWLRAAR